MTVGLSTANLANKILDHLRVGTAWTQPAAIFFKLHTADPGAAGATAAAVGDATRKAAAYAAAASGSMSQTGTNPTWTNGGTSETLTHISVWDASSAGNFLYSFALSSSQAWASTNTFTLTSYSFALTPLAA
jgi:hypothetical protein